MIQKSDALLVDILSRKYEIILKSKSWENPRVAKVRKHYIIFWTKQEFPKNKIFLPFTNSKVDSNNLLDKLKIKDIFPLNLTIG